MNPLQTVCTLSLQDFWEGEKDGRMSSRSYTVLGVRAYAGIARTCAGT